MRGLMLRSTQTCWWTPQESASTFRQVTVIMDGCSDRAVNCPFKKFSDFDVSRLKLRCKHEQRCRHLSAGILKSTCYIDVRWFPFDVQKCDLKFGSWTHNGWLLDLQMIDVDISTYIPNGEWDLVGKRGKCRIKRSRSLGIFCWALKCSHANFLKKRKKNNNL